MCDDGQARELAREPTDHEKAIDIGVDLQCR